MTDPLDLDRQLRAAGSRSVPPPGPAFGRHLEDRLRELHASTDARRSPSRPGLRLAAAAVLVLVGLTVSLALISRSRPTDRVLLADVRDAEIALPDGSVVTAEPGAEVPNGSVVRTGDGGHAEVDGQVVPHGSEAVVVDGDVMVLPGPDTSSEPPPSSTTTSPATTQPETAITSADSTASSVPVATTATKVQPARLELVAARRERAVELRWSAYRGPGFARYKVVRTLNSGDTVVAESTDQTTTSAVDRPGDTAVSYRVLAFDAKGTLIAASSPATLRAVATTS